MKYRLGGLLIGVLATLATPAVSSEVHQIAAWRSQLQQAMCGQNWSQAIGVSGALVGSEIHPSERIWLLALRQDLFAYQAGTTPFSQCEGNTVMAGATQESVRLLTAQSSFNWEGTLERMGMAGATSGAPDEIVVSNSVAIAALTTPSNADLLGIERPAEIAYTACQPVSTGDFRVASGAISHRWVYEIWQNVDTFYLQYWRQSQTCTQALTMGGFETQQEARQYMFDLRSNESVGNIAQ
ncbi:MAG: hypothetical protein KME15_04935 [Drouetiella hepatica Uher 2000/2452]|jgi:hypothetical protein|uniref:Uncharacterized protein n=1 Tax=Drouetiella hepatica Uher 2000/2452 TaxID=904376 RepID=A0A951UKU7_9CYAN|nr:hypothetical protein [Drouetiella hepatica Uher 2000/2452]